MLGVGLQILFDLPLDMLLEAKNIVSQHTAQIAVELRSCSPPTCCGLRGAGPPEQERERSGAWPTSCAR